MGVYLYASTAAVATGGRSADPWHPGNDRAVWSVHIFDLNKTLLLSS